MAATSEVIADLRRAIADVRSECHGDPRCEDLLDLLDRAEEAAKEVSYGDDSKNGKSKPKDDKADADEDRKDGGKDEDTEDRPKNLRDAADETRRRFQTARNSRDRDALKRKSRYADDDD